MTEFMQPLFQETTDPGNCACAQESSCCVSSTDWSAKLGAVELVDGTGMWAVALSSLVGSMGITGFCGVVLSSSAGTGGTAELVDKIEMYVAVLTSLLGSAGFCGVALSSCPGTHGTL